MFGPYFKGAPGTCTCCETPIPPSLCDVCACFNEGQTLTIETGEEYLQWVPVCHDEDPNPSVGNAGVLAGSIPLIKPCTPPGTPWCGTCLEASPCGSGASDGSVPDVSGGAPRITSGFCVYDSQIYYLEQTAGWLAHWDLAERTVDIYLAFWTWICGGVGCNSGVWSYIRWRYEYETDDCDGIINPTHVATKHWSVFGNIDPDDPPEGSDGGTVSCFYGGTTCEGTGAITRRTAVPICTIADDEVDAEVGQYMGTPCYFWYDTDDTDTTLGRDPIPGEADHWVIKSLTPPRVEIRTCNIYPCCETEGGPPTAAIDWTAESCEVTATDVSTPGTCGSIVRRRWLLQIWNEDPATSGATCPDFQVPSEAEGEDLGDNETITLSAMAGCGGKWFRLLLTIWDSTGCRSDASTDVLTCCSCVDRSGNPCPAPTGGLTITELTDCGFRLTANVAGEGTCGDGDPVVLWWRGSTGAECIDPEDAPCDDYPNFCPSSLLNGQHIDITIDGCETIYWTTRAATCGCLGPIQSQQICCKNCDCCEEAIRVFVTLSGFAQNGVNDCLCENINGTWELTKSGSGTAQPCVYELQPPGGWVNGSCNLGLEIELTISCFAGEMYGTLSINGGNSIFLEGGLAGDDCTALPAAMTTSYAIPNLCTTGSVSLSIVPAAA